MDTDTAFTAADYHRRRAREARQLGAICGNSRERLLYEEFAQLHELQARLAMAAELRDPLRTADAR
jgi:hypothetical protein